MKTNSNQSLMPFASKSTKAPRTATLPCAVLTVLCFALAVVPTAFGQANLQWTKANGSITDGPGTWNQGAASLPSGAPWYNGSTYGNQMNSGDIVTFGGGTAGSTSGNVTITNGTTLSPSIIISLTPNGTGTYYIGTNGFNSGGTGSSAGNPVNMPTGGTITNWSSTGIAFGCPVNGSFNVGAGANGFNSKVIFNGDGNQTGTNIINVQAGTMQCGYNSGQRGSVGAAQIILNNNAGLIWRRSTLAGGFIVSNAVSGSGSVQYQLNGGLFIVQSNQTYSGATWVLPTATSSTYATLRLGAANVFPTNTDLQLNQVWNAAFNGPTNVVTFDMNGFNQTVGSIATDTNSTTTPSSAIITGGSTCTLTLAGTGRTKFFNGQITGGLNLTLNGSGSKLTLTNANTYTGNTTINAGTLALGPNASINNSAQITIGAGAMFDVSLIPSFTLSSSTTFSAGGTTNAAMLKGASGGTVSLGSQPIILNYDGTGTNAALTVSQGQLVLNGNLFTVNGPALAPNGYLIITNIGNSISSSGSYSVNGSALFGTLGTINVTGGAVYLHVVTANVSLANSSVTASPNNLPADNSSSSTVTVIIKDPSNVPIVGLGVNWSVSGSDNTVSPAASGVTDGSGQVTFTVKSAKAETKLVTVTVGANTITNSLAITFTAPGSGNSFTWDPAHTPGTGSNGSGTWDTNSANWANGGGDFAWPNNGNDTANFGLSAALPSSYIVTLGSPVTVGNINFLYNNSQEYDFEGTNTLTFAGTPTITTYGGFTRFNCPLAGTGFNANLQLANSTLRIQNDNTNYTGNVTLNGQGTLQFGYNGTSGNLGSGTITLNDSVSVVVRRGGGSMVWSNLVTGSTSGGKVGFQLNGGVVVTLAQANTYTAPTYQQPTGTGNNSGTLQLGINNALPTSTDFTMDNSDPLATSGSPGSVQTFDLAGFNQTLNSLATDAYAAPTNTIITNSTSTVSTLTLNGSGVSTTFGGKMVGKVNLTLAGSSSTLTIQQTNSLSALSIVTITNGAVLDLAFTGTNQIAGLVINGVSKTPGVYSAATDSPSLVDTGYLLVVPVATINPNPPVLQVSFGSGNMSLGWPTNLGWILQSNSVSLTTTSAWHNYPADGSVTVTNVSITVDPTKTNVFYRMLKP